jgi:hypothetical protein
MIKGSLIATEVQEYFRDSLCFLLHGVQDASARSRDLWQPAKVVIKYRASRGSCPASARATFAWTSLVETLTVMSARVVPDASITIPLHGSSLNATNIAADFALATSLRQATQALATAAREASSRPQDETRVVP